MDKEEKSVFNPSISISFKEDLHQTLDLCKDDEQFPDYFKCSICLDLLYKPVVLACGHVSCFWCVHKSMNNFRSSRCPKCRNEYYHFPCICQLLHSVFVKLYPVAYKRREMEVLEEENDADCFSPQFEDHSDTTTVNSYACHASSERSNLGGFVDQLDCDTCHDEATNAPRNSNSRDFEGDSNISLEEKKLPENGQVNGIHKQLSTDDVLCVACKQLLLRPSVLNCGHVYCEACVPTPKDESIRCQVCQSLHPGEFPKVCLDFDKFLVEQFPEEYAHHRKVIHGSGVSCQQKDPSACATQVGKVASKSSIWIDDLTWWHEHGPKLHVGVGCDSCGMYPIIGKRYKCVDCKEAVGFDLCEDCYSTSSKLPGRFNQQHTPEHRFEVVQSSMFRNIVMRVMGGQSEDNSDASTLSNHASEESENRDSTA
ncbi:hypothetical protein MRB53_015870 [Persea americana]|uniref:Uncharacterized protein n=1 Tax=Persea americana TaxID=3435 RepID=A0ACC2M095_PERAE|nr:hypothetical protein MRB53_015870 [Persea americana]